MSIVTRFLFACAFLACAATASAVDVADTCSLPLDGSLGTRAAGTTIGSYLVYARTGNAPNMKRFFLPGTSIDLQGLTKEGDLGSVIDPTKRSLLVGLLYTFERLNPASTGNNDPTYPVWYFLPRNDMANGTAVSYDLPVHKATFSGQFGSGGGTKFVDPNPVGLLSLRAAGGNKQFNAHLSLNGREADFCLELENGTPANTEPAPGASVQGIWGSEPPAPFSGGSVVVTRSSELRAVLTFFDQRSDNTGQPIWGYSDLTAAVDTFPLNMASTSVHVPYNGEVWDCTGRFGCSSSPLTSNVGTLAPLRLGTTTGADQSLNVGAFKPTLSGSIHGIPLSWTASSMLSLGTQNCTVRMDATPTGLAIGGGTQQNNCPESTPQEPAFATCATPAGQGACPVVLRWRVTDAYPNARVVAIDMDAPATPIAVANPGVLVSTGMSFSIPAGKRYRFAVLSGDGAAPVIGRTQVIQATIAPAVAATGCTITSGTSCNVGVTWSGGTGAPALYRYTVPASGNPVLVSNAASGGVTDALGVGRYRYELHSASPPSAQNLLAASNAVDVTGGASGVSVSPANCPIVAPAITCSASVSWNTTATASPFLFRIGVTPATSAQPVPISGQSGAVTQSLAAGVYRFELRSSSDSASATNLLAVSGNLTVTGGSLGEPEVPPAPVEPTPPASDPESEKVGFTGGAFRVDEAGNATYRVPLSLLPGRAGLTPQLALSYSSGNGDGIAGWGMSLEGVGVIARCRLSLEAGDGANRAIGLSPDTFGFCLNGQRLIKVSAHADGAAGAEYRTEIDSYQRIIIDGTEVVLPNGSGTPFSQPTAFTVHTKDGLIAHYGTGAARRRATLPSHLGGVANAYVEDWWLASLSDRNGNEIAFDYTGSTAAGSLQLDRIRYEGGQVDFVYDARTPVVSIGAWGARVQHDRSLKRILVSTGAPVSTPLHHYELSYEPLPSNPALRRVSSLATCRGTLCQAPTVFDWHDLDVGSQDSAGQGNLPNGGANFQDIRAYKYGDINGDGRADMVWVDKTKALRISLSQPTAGGGLGFAASFSPTMIECERNSPNDVDACSSEGFQRTWALLDYNADGRDDLIAYQTINGAGAWRIWLSNGSTLVRTVNLAEDPVTGDRLPGTPRAMLADFDGDGLGDLLVNRVSGFGTDARLHLLRKSGNPAMPFQFSPPYPLVQQNADGSVNIGPLCNVGQFIAANGDRSDAIDFNGDGSADLALRLPSGTCGSGGTAESTPDWLERQAHEPGAAIVDLSGQSTAVVFASKGVDAQNRFVFTLLPSLLGLDAANPETLRFGDINGDGYVDALVRRAGNTAPGLNGWDEVWGYFYGTPRGWDGPIGGHCARADAVGNCLPMGREGQVSLLDYDGDGRLDVLSRRYSSSASGDFTYDAMLWNGSGFSAPAATFFQGGDSTWMRGFSDIDGDGYYDNLIMRASEVGASWKAKRRSSHHKPRNVLERIGYGLGATTHIDYAPLTFSTVYQRHNGAASLNYGRGSVVLDVLAPRYVVSTIRSSAPTAANPGNVAEMRYRYSGYRLQGGGRGGLGFLEVISVDVENALTTSTEYQQRFPLIGVPRRTLVWSEAARPDLCADPDAAVCMTATGWTSSNPALVYSASGEIWRWEADGVAGNNPDLATLVGASRKPLRVLRASSIGNKRESTGAAGFVSATHTTFGSYDAFGNLLTSTTIDYGDEALATTVRTVTTSNTYDNNPSLWILGRLRQSTITTARPGVPDNVRTTTFDYNATTGQLEVERLQPGGSLSESLIKVHRYDGYGNEYRTISCSRSLSEADCKAKQAADVVFQSTDDQYVQRMSGRDFDHRGLYVNVEWEVFKPLTGVGSEVVSFVLARDDFGNATRFAELNGMTRLAAFDGFGRAYFAGDSTGAWTLTERRWCNGFSGGGNAVRVSCPAGATYRVRQTAVASPAAWSYRDVLDREILRVSEGLAPSEFSAVRTAYDKLGRVAAVSEPYFTFSPVLGSVGQPSASAIYETATHYDMFGRVRLVVHPNNGVNGAVSQTETIYEPRKVTTRLPQNANLVAQSTTREVNALGELYKVTDHLGSTLTYRYDAAGNVTEVTRPTRDGTSVATTATFDVLGRKLSVVDPDRGTWNFRYNALGEVVRKWSPGGSCEKLLYDARGRVYSRRNYPNTLCVGTADATTDWAYDTAANGLGQLDIVTHSDESQPYSRVHHYDAFGRARETVTTIAGSDYADAVTYDQYGRPFQKFFSGTGIPRSGELQQYSARGFATVVRNAFPGTTGQVYYELLSTDAAGRPARERRAGSDNLITTKTYAPSTGRIDSIVTGAAVQQIGYGFDALGNMTWREDRSGGGFLRETFGYDNLQRLTSAQAQRANGLQEWTFAAAYDVLGNNLGQTVGTRGEDCTAGNEVQPGPGATSVIGTNQFCYDARGNQVRTMDRANAPGWEKRKIRYSSYDLARDIRNNNPFTAHVSQFVYGPERSMVLRRDYANATASGTPQLTYYAGGAEIIVKTGAPKEIRRNVASVLLTQRIDANGAMIGVVQDVLLTDALGSTHRITDTSGTPRDGNGVQLFSPFGVRANAATGVSLDGNSRFNFDDSRTRDGFTGHQQIDATGLIHMGARLYDPVLARFVQADSIVPDAADLQQFNRYTYVSNNPLAFTDPTGNWGAQQQGYLRVAGAIVIAVATAGVAGPVVGGQVTATQMGIYMAGGFASGALATGNLRGAVTGSFTSLAMAGLAGNFVGQEKTIGAIVANAAAGGVIEQVNGGKFGHGFISAGFTAALVPHIATGSDFANGVLHAIVGGTASELSGGKFANGALTAVFGYAVGGFSRRATNQASGDSLNAANSSLSDLEWSGEARGTGLTGRQLKDAVSVGKWALNKYGSKCTTKECGGYVYLLGGKFFATAAVGGERHQVSLLPAQDLVPDGATIVLDYHIHDRPPAGLRNDFFSPYDVTAINAFSKTHSGFVGGLVGAQGSAYFYKAGWLPDNPGIPAIRNVQLYLGHVSK